MIILARFHDFLDGAVYLIPWQDPAFLLCGWMVGWTAGSGSTPTTKVARMGVLGRIGWKKD
jgi:hypothetical protein